MGWMLWTGFLVLSVFLWWAGFYATKRMRVKKNEAREKLAKQLLAERDVANAKAASENE